MKKPILTIFQYLFFLGLGVLFVWLMVKDVTPDDWAQIRNSLKKARHWVIIPVAGMLILSHYSRAIRWKLLMEPLGYKPSTFNTFAAVMIGYLVNAGVPRLGEVVKCTILSRYEKVRADRLVGTIVVERAVDVVSLFLIFALALVFEGHVIGDFTSKLFGDFFRDKSGAVSLTRLLLFGTGVLGFFALVYVVLKRFGHIDAVAKIRHILLGILHGLNSIRLIRRKGLFLLHSFLIWALYLLSTTAGIYALTETEHLGLGGGLTTLAIGSVGMIITPGGIGAYPLLVAKLMELYGLDFSTTGTALGWLLWSVQTLIIILGGVLFFALLSHFNKKERTIETRKQHQEENINMA